MLTEANLSSKNLINRIGLCIQYNGFDFCGWQRQRQGSSIQKVLEEAISQLDPQNPIKAVAAGRTDAGVHASGQVVHFDTCGHIPPKRWAKALNGRLPPSIRIRESVLRPIEWHACHSAIYRRYRYTIYNGLKPNLFLAPWSWHRYRFRLDENLMKEGLIKLLGFHDFSAFQRAGSKRAHGWTTIQDVNLERNGDLIFIEIQASGFLYGMVRLLVGQLIAVGEHRLSIQSFEKSWREARRDDIKEAAPAKGLCLLRAGYKEFIFSKSEDVSSFPKFSLIGFDSPHNPL